MLSLILTSLLYLGICLLLLWLVSLARRDSSIIDSFWGLGFVIVAWIGFAQGSGLDPRKLLVALLVTLWGVRLAGYISWRNWGKGEDYRYQTWRKAAGASWWWRSLFKVFLLQGVLMAMIAAPLWVVATSAQPAALTWLDWLGAAFVLVGVGFEAIGDAQLARFKSNPSNKGKVMDSGLWRFTRHPNYFGDAVVWWGLGVIALGAGGWWALYAPLLMNLLLVRVSGVALLEKGLEKTKPGYAEYVRRTNSFFPWFPRKAG